MWMDSPLLRDAGAAVLTGVAAAVVLRFWEEVANRALLDQKLCRKLVHITVGLVYFLMWPLFSSDDLFGPFLAPLIIIVNIIKVTVIGLGLVKDEGVVNSMTRHGDHRELLKGPLYYACAITLTTIVFWRTSLISIAVICNLCAGDGVADIFGRRFGRVKLPHNPEKSYAGSIAMFLAGFIASVLFMCYFSIFGFVEKSWTMVSAFGIISLVAAVVESLPISTRLDDNLTVPVASVLFGALVFYSIGGRNLCCMSSENRRSIAATVGMVFAGAAAAETSSHSPGAELRRKCRERSASSILMCVCVSCLVTIFRLSRHSCNLRIIKKDKERGKTGISLYSGKESRSS